MPRKIVVSSPDRIAICLDSILVVGALRFLVLKQIAYSHYFPKCKFSTLKRQTFPGLPAGVRCGGRYGSLRRCGSGGHYNIDPNRRLSNGVITLKLQFFGRDFYTQCSNFLLLISAETVLVNSPHLSRSQSQPRVLCSSPLALSASSFWIASINSFSSNSRKWSLICFIFRVASSQKSETT